MNLKIFTAAIGVTFLLVTGSFFVLAQDIVEDEVNDEWDIAQTSALLSNGYLIEFVSVEYNNDGTSTWTYRVQETDGAKDLSNWVLGLPECATVVDANPWGYEIVNPDPNSQIDGIKWETTDSFEDGYFSVTLDDYYEISEVTVAAKGGTDVAYADIEGPSCEVVEQEEDDPVEVPPVNETIDPIDDTPVNDTEVPVPIDDVIDPVDNSTCPCEGREGNMYRHRHQYRWRVREQAGNGGCQGQMQQNQQQSMFGNMHRNQNNNNDCQGEMTQNQQQSSFGNMNQNQNQNGGNGQEDCDNEGRRGR